MSSLTVVDRHYVAVTDLAAIYFIVDLPLRRDLNHFVAGIEAVLVGVAIFVSQLCGAKTPYNTRRTTQRINR